MHAYMHAQFAALMTLPMTEPRRMPIVSCDAYLWHRDQSERRDGRQGSLH